MLASARLARLIAVRQPSSATATPASIRLHSAWINAATADSDSSLSSKKVDVERQFTDPSVQELLAEITGLDLEGKVFRQRRTGLQQRSHFALMTEERLDKTMDKMTAEARRFLSPVPLKEPRPDKFTVLAKDEEIAAFDTSRFVFTDITFDATDQDRAVVVREIDGTLRTATPEEHDRMNRVYYEKPNRPVNVPSVFSDPWLNNALERNEHEFVLDWSAWYYEPDDPSFIDLSRTIFDRVLSAKKFDVLYSTRHFGTFAFYLALNGNTPPLLNWFGGLGKLAEAARVVRLQKILHPNWRVAVSKEDSDRKIIEDFIRQNERLKSALPDLLNFLNNGELRADKDTRIREERQQAVFDKRRKNVHVNASTVGTTAGPLGSLSEEYPVHLSRSENVDSGEGDGTEGGQPAPEGRRRGGDQGRRGGEGEQGGDRGNRGGRFNIRPRGKGKDRGDKPNE